MTIFVVPDGRDAWNFHGAADVDGGKYVRGRVSRQSAVVIEDLPGGGLRYRGLGMDIPCISGGSDAPDDPRGGGVVLGEGHGPPLSQARQLPISRSTTGAKASTTSSNTTQ
jgi:hypothetical protein